MQRRSLLLTTVAALAGCGPKLTPVPAADDPAPPRKIHVPRAAAPAPPPDAPAAAGDKGFAEITWAMLRGLDTRTGQASPLLELAAGTDVKIAGYMVPFDDGFEEAIEFLVVPTAGACVHTPAPPANQIVYASMVTGRPAKVELLYSVWVCGRLEIGSTDSPYGQAGFKLATVKVERRA
ncbi:MAG: DUF3299 domain-containing protein [Acidobacteriaceae bacterium]|jgi:hypothetical protein|nr:DUF3299 domain-containing protein [Acidobacteriaceae bacterium]